jgi:hypothetical protein
MFGVELARARVLWESERCCELLSHTTDIGVANLDLNKASCILHLSRSGLGSETPRPAIQGPLVHPC